MTPRLSTPHRIALGLTVVWLALVLPIQAGEAPVGPEAPAHAMLTQFLQSDRVPLVSYRARRFLEASTKEGSMAASLEAWTELGTDGRFGFEVVRESGSGLIRRHVLIAALLEEQRLNNARRTGEAALSPENYVR